jgi:hypothetical protein
MSGDKRSVATDALEVLGTVITDKKVGRDAVHLACFPAKTFDSLTGPGAHVGLLEDGRVSVYAAKPIGIIDPFLPDLVKAGQEVLVLVYPRTIESLRHVWSHPDVPEENKSVAVLMPQLTVEMTQPVLDRNYLTARLAEIGRTLDPPVSASRLEEAMDEGYVTVYGEDAYGEIPLPPEVWQAYENVHGRMAIADPRRGQQGVYFTCSC